MPKIDLDLVRDELKSIRFHDFHQYASDVLHACQIPRSTIKRLLDSSKDEISVYRRALILHMPKLNPEKNLAEALPMSGHRLILLVNGDHCIGKDLVDGSVVSFKPDEICNYLYFFFPLIFGAVLNRSFDTTINFAKVVGSLCTQLSLDPKNRGKHDTIVEFILTVIHLSFLASILEDETIQDVLKWAQYEDQTDYTQIASDILSSTLEGRKVSTECDLLPDWSFLERLVEVPHIDKEAFDLVASVLCFDLSEVESETLGSLIYKLVQKQDSSSIYGHRTSSDNVNKLLDPLFVSDYSKRLAKHKDNPSYLSSLQTELLNLRFFDPTNGPGCFLAAALNSVVNISDEIDGILKTDSEIDVGNFVGLVDNHVCKDLSRLSLWATYLQYLKNRGTVSCAKAGVVYKKIDLTIADQLITNWEQVCPNSGHTLIVGSPIFKGRKNTSAHEKKQMNKVFGSARSGNADYCSCWLFLAAKYIGTSSSRCALVLTNSVCQGSQVAFIWRRIYSEGCEIDFAHRSFKWRNQDQSTGVTVIILGLASAKHQSESKDLWTEDSHIQVSCIGPYLIDSKKTIVRARNKTLCSQLPPIRRGNMPYDAGGELSKVLCVTKKQILKLYPEAKEFFKRIVGSSEFIHHIERWCLWIPTPEKLAKAKLIPPIIERVDRVRDWRIMNSDSNVRKLAQRPYQFREVISTVVQTLVVPLLSSEKRPYIPIGFIGDNCIGTNLAGAIYECPTWVFGVISSRMHNSWIATVCGGFETRLRYSGQLGYNTFPFPKISSTQQERIERLSLSIIAEREKNCNVSLGDLYNDLPENLKTLHRRLDDFIDGCYREEGFTSDLDRVRYLFNYYEELLQT